MGMATILFNGAEPFKQTTNNLSTEGPMWIYWNCSSGFRGDIEKLRYTILCMYIAQGQGQIILRG